MIRAHISADANLFERDRVGILVLNEDDSFPHRQLVFVPGNGLRFDDPEVRGDEWVDLESEAGVQVAHPYTLDVPRYVAKAVYEALGEVFAPKDPTPLASDRAYSDARTDIDRAHGLISKLVDAVTAPPVHLWPEGVSGPPERRT
jgi:hypothetical protein